MPSSETMTIVGAASAALDVLNSLPVEDLPQLAGFTVGMDDGRPLVECQVGAASHGELADTVRALLAWHGALNGLAVAALDAKPQRFAPDRSRGWFASARMLIEPADVWLDVWALVTVPAEIDAAMQTTTDPERAGLALVAGVLGAEQDDDEPDREPSAETERGWDLADADRRGHALGGDS